VLVPLALVKVALEVAVALVLVAVVTVEIVIVVAVVILVVEIAVVGCKYCLLISPTSPTTSPVSFDFTQLVTPKILLICLCDSLHADNFSPLNIP